MEGTGFAFGVFIQVAKQQKCSSTGMLGLAGILRGAGAAWWCQPCPAPAVTPLSQEVLAPSVHHQLLLWSSQTSPSLFSTRIKYLCICFQTNASEEFLSWQQFLGSSSLYSLHVESQSCEGWKIPPRASNHSPARV